MVALVEPGAVDKTTTLETLLQTPAGKRMMTCIQCGTCAGTCPYGEYMDFSPRLVINMLRGGFIDEATLNEKSVALKCEAAEVEKSLEDQAEMDPTRGHGTHSLPAIWGRYLEEFLRSLP